MSKTKRKAVPATRDGWAQANDAGPHLVELPSRTTVSIRIPDNAALIRAGKLPENLRTTALMVAAHPEGGEGYFADMVATGIVHSDQREVAAKAISEGLELSHILVAEMLVEPRVSVEDVAGGVIPELDVRMLLEFAERRRSVDAAGNEVPVMTLDQWARFRNVPDRSESPQRGGANGHDDAGALPADAADGAL